MGWTVAAHAVVLRGEVRGYAAGHGEQHQMIGRYGNAHVLTDLMIDMTLPI